MEKSGSIEVSLEAARSLAGTPRNSAGGPLRLAKPDQERVNLGHRVADTDHVARGERSEDDATAIKPASRERRLRHRIPL